MSEPPSDKGRAGAPGEVSGPSENFTDDKGRVEHPSKKINGEPMPPAGYGHVYDDEGNRETVPVELHPTLLPEPEKLSRDRIANRALMEWIRLCEFHRGKCTAFLVVINEEKGHPDDIAKALGITERQFRNYRTEARVWLDGFIAGLDSEALPIKGENKA